MNLSTSSSATNNNGTGKHKDQALVAASSNGKDNGMLKGVTLVVDDRTGGYQMVIDPSTFAHGDKKLLERQMSVLTDGLDTLEKNRKEIAACQEESNKGLAEAEGGSQAKKIRDSEEVFDRMDPEAPAYLAACEEMINHGVTLKDPEYTERYIWKKVECIDRGTGIATPKENMPQWGVEKMLEVYEALIMTTQKDIAERKELFAQAKVFLSKLEEGNARRAHWFDVMIGMAITTRDEKIVKASIEEKIALDPGAPKNKKIAKANYPEWACVHLSKIHSLKAIDSFSLQQRDGATELKKAEYYFGFTGNEKNEDFFDAWFYFIDAMRQSNVGEKAYHSYFEKAKKAYLKFRDEARDSRGQYFYMAAYVLQIAALRRLLSINEAEIFFSHMSDYRNLHEIIPGQPISSEWQGSFAEDKTTGAIVFIPSAIKPTRTLADGIKRLKIFIAACDEYVVSLSNTFNALQEELSGISEAKKQSSKVQKAVIGQQNVAQSIRSAKEAKFRALKETVVVAASSGDFDTAIEILMKDIGTNWGRGNRLHKECFEDACYQIGICYLGVGKFEYADSYFMQALKPDCVKVIANHGRLLNALKLLASSAAEGEKSQYESLKEKYTQSLQDYYFSEVILFLDGEKEKVNNPADRIRMARGLIRMMQAGSGQQQNALKAVEAYEAYCEFVKLLDVSIFPEMPFAADSVKVKQIADWVKTQVTIRKTTTDDALEKAQKLFDEKIKGSRWESAATDGIGYVKEADGALVKFCETIIGGNGNLFESLEQIKDAARLKVADVIVKASGPDGLYVLFSRSIKEGNAERAAKYLDDLKGSKYEQGAKDALGALCEKKAGVYLATGDLENAVEFLKHSFGTQHTTTILSRFLEVCLKKKRWDLVDVYLAVIKQVGKKKSEEAEAYKDACAGFAETLLEAGEFLAATTWMEALRELEGGLIPHDVLLEFIKKAKKDHPHWGSYVLGMNAGLQERTDESAQYAKEEANKYILEISRSNARKKFSVMMESGDLDGVKKGYTETDDPWMLEKLLEYFVQNKQWKEIDALRMHSSESKNSTLETGLAFISAMHACFKAGHHDLAYACLELIKQIDTNADGEGDFLALYFDALGWAIEQQNNDLVDRLRAMADGKIKQFLDVEEFDAAQRLHGAKIERAKAQLKAKKKRGKSKPQNIREVSHSKMVTMKTSYRLRVHLGSELYDAIEKDDDAAMFDKIAHVRPLYKAMQFADVKIAQQCAAVVTFCLESKVYEEAYEWLVVIKEISDRLPIGAFFKEVGRNALMAILTSGDTELIKKTLALAESDQKSFWKDHFSQLIEKKDIVALKQVLKAFSEMQYAEAEYARMCQSVAVHFAKHNEVDEVFKWFSVANDIAKRSQSQSVFVSMARAALANTKVTPEAWSAQLNKLIEAKDWDTLKAYREVIASLEYSNVAYGKIFARAAEACFDAKEYKEAIEWLDIIRSIDRRDENEMYFEEIYFGLLLKALGMTSQPNDFLKDIVSLSDKYIKRFVGDDERVKLMPRVEEKLAKLLKSVGRMQRHTLPNRRKEIKRELRIKENPITISPRFESYVVDVSKLNVWTRKKLKLEDKVLGVFLLDRVESLITSR